MHHARFYPVRFSPVPVIMESPDDKAVLFDKRALLRQYLIAITSRKLRFIEMIEERRLVGDDQITSRLRSAFQNIERRHHRHGDSRYRRVWIAGLERIHGIAFPRNANLGLNALDHLPSGQLFLLSE